MAMLGDYYKKQKLSSKENYHTERNVQCGVTFIVVVSQ